MTNATVGNMMSDIAVKCGIRHFDLRVFRDCAIIYSEVRREAPASSGQQAAAATPLLTLILQKCTRDPMQLSEMCKRVARLLGTDKYTLRVDALREMEHLGMAK